MNLAKALILNSVFALLHQFSNIKNKRYVCLTCSEEHNGLQTTILGGVDVQGFQLLYLFLLNSMENKSHESHTLVIGFIEIQFETKV